MVAAILDFFPKGLACDFGSKFQISCNFVVKMDLEKMFGDVLESNQSDPLHIWTCQIWAVAILDFFKRG